MCFHELNQLIAFPTKIEECITLTVIETLSVQRTSSTACFGLVTQKSWCFHHFFKNFKSTDTVGFLNLRVLLI